MKRYLSGALACGAVWLTACGDHITTQPRLSAGTIAAAADRDDVHDRHAVGGVYVGTNATTGNAVVAFTRYDNGTLAKIGEFKTGGVGIGGAVDPLFSQGSVLLSPNNKRLYVVNAGSNSISTFSVSDDASLRLLGTVSSSGSGPISLALMNNRLYVLNRDNSVSGFSVDGDDLPRPVSRSRITLGAATDGPSTINASHNGKFLFVTQRVANAIDVIAVSSNGDLNATSRRTSSGSGPFGFAVTDHDQLIVAEASGAAPNGAVSSYRLIANGKLALNSASVSTHQAATCWLVLTKDERFAFTANAGSGSISGFDVSSDGSLAALDADGRTGVTNGTGAKPLDMDVTRDGKFLYTLQSGTGTVGGFAIGSHARLTTLPDTPGLAAAAGFQGIAAF
jgi:6-phosphogluconolactonase